MATLESNFNPEVSETLANLPGDMYRKMYYDIDCTSEKTRNILNIPLENK